MTHVHTGSCLCGDITYKVTGEFKKFLLCHCSRCQKTSGSAHCANLFAPKAKLLWLSGEELLTFFKLKDTNYARHFCSMCSSLMPVSLATRDMVMVPAGSLDSNIGITPQAHIFTDSKGSWDDVLNYASCFEERPS